MCPVDYVCIPQAAHYFLLALSISAFLLLMLNDISDQPKPPQDEMERLRKKWKDNTPRK